MPFRESDVPSYDPAPNSDMIRLTDVHLKLASAAGPVNILRGIDLTVAPGERVAILGPSGSGKSTLLMVIGGLERPTSGQVLVGGEDLVQLDEDRLARFRRGTVGIVFQSFHLIPTMSALENVAVPLELAGHTDAFSRAAEELERVGLAARAEHYPGQLSGGEQQRGELARAFAIRPRLLLADEPPDNLAGHALGVAAIAGVGSLGAAVRAGIAADARILRGGDLELRQVYSEITPEQRDLLSSRARVSEVAQTHAMARRVDNAQRRLVELK